METKNKNKNKSKHRAFFSFYNLRHLRFKDPCTKCMVFAACTQICMMKKDYRRTCSIKESMKIGMGATLFISIPSIFGGVLIGKDKKIIGIGFILMFLIMIIHAIIQVEED